MKDWRLSAWVSMATVLVLIWTWFWWEAGRAESAHLAIQAYDREEQYQALLVPMVEQMEAALTLVEAHDSVRAREIRAAMPADVLSVLEVEP